MENVATTIQVLELDLIEALLSERTEEVMSCVVSLNDFLKEKNIPPSEDLKFVMKSGLKFLSDRGKINLVKEEVTA